MTLTPFRGRCHTCGHDHDAEETLARDVIELTRQADAERRRKAAAVPVEVVQAVDLLDDWISRVAEDDPGASLSINTIRAFLATLQAAEPAAKKEPQ